MLKEIYIIKKLLHTVANGVSLNWHERNSGNITLLLDENEVNELKPYLNENTSEIELPMEVPFLANQYVIASGSGKFFGNAEIDFAKVFGIIKVSNDGKTYKKVAGYENGNNPTSELPTHLLLLNQNVKIGNKKRVVYHCHPTNLNTLTFIETQNSYEFSAKLWKHATEAAVVIPNGVGLLPWMMPGSLEIGLASIKLMKEFDAILWVHHGVFATADTLDNTFGMIHVMEKSAEIIILIKSTGDPIKNEITKKNIIDLGKTFEINLNKKIIEKL